MKFIYNLLFLIIVLFLLNPAFADSIDETLKNDFSKQETIKIKFEINKRLFSYEAGNFKIKEIKSNKEKIRSIAARIIPWAIMEHLTPPEVARIIEYMYHADQSGASFFDAEDLIPLVARYDIPLKDFILMVEYMKETKAAGIPDEIRDSFLGYSFSNSWDGVSILAGGRGLILAKSAKLNINKTASLLTRKLPAKGAAAKKGQIKLIVENIIGESAAEKNSLEIINNFNQSHESYIKSENTPEGLKEILVTSIQSGIAIESVKKIDIPEKTVVNSLVDKEQGLITDEIQKSENVNWKILSRKDLFSEILPWLGVPYKYGGKSKNGIDCSGFTRKVLISKKVGVPKELISYSSTDQSNAGSPVARKNIRAGDLVFFSASPDKKKITHVGLATSNANFTHASMKGVINDSLEKKWWTQRFIKSRRIFTEVRE